MNPNLTFLRIFLGENGRGSSYTVIKPGTWNHFEKTPFLVGGIAGLGPSSIEEIHSFQVYIQ